MIREALKNGWRWWRIANSSWSNPLDPSYAQERGGGWNPPNSFPTLYLNEDVVTARHNLRLFIASWPYEPEDLRSDNGPILVGATLPRNQVVCDAHSPEGVRALNLPASYPVDRFGQSISRGKCQQIGRRVKNKDLRGVRARSGQSNEGVGRELAWFPATPRSSAKRVATEAFDAWYWG